VYFVALDSGERHRLSAENAFAVSGGGHCGSIPVGWLGYLSARADLKVPYVFILLPQRIIRMVHHMSKRLATVTAFLLLGACAGTPPLQSSADVQVIDATDLPPPSGGLADSKGYRIGAFDRLLIDVVGFPELDKRELQVDSSGRVAVPMAGSVNVAGMTPAEVEQQIVKQMRAAHVRNPQVTVNLKESLSRYVTVDGQVGMPGNYPVVADMTLMRAVAAARGAGEFAKLEDVVVFRNVDGQQMAALYNLGAIRRGQYGDPSIYPMDVIVVGNSNARRIFRDIIATAPLLTAPLVAILRK